MKRFKVTRDFLDGSVYRQRGTVFEASEKWPARRYRDYVTATDEPVTPDNQIPVENSASVNAGVRFGKWTEIVPEPQRRPSIHDYRPQVGIRELVWGSRRR